MIFALAAGALVLWLVLWILFDPLVVAIVYGATFVGVLTLVLSESRDHDG